DDQGGDDQRSMRVRIYHGARIRLASLPSTGGRVISEGGHLRVRHRHGDSVDRLAARDGRGGGSLPERPRHGRSADMGSDFRQMRPVAVEVVGRGSTVVAEEVTVGAVLVDMRNPGRLELAL